MIFFIPSRGRKNIVDRYTLPQLYNILKPGDKIFIIVTGPEYVEYANVLQRFDREKVRLAECPHYNLPQTCDWIVEACSTSLVDKCFIVDDDLTFFYKRWDTEDRAKYATPEQLRQGFEDMEEALSDQVPMVGMRHKRFSNRRHTSAIRFDRRIIGVMGLYIPVVKHFSFDWGHESLSDQYMNLALIEAGYHTATVTGYVFDSYQAQFGEGGCSAYRTPATYSAACHALVERFPLGAKLRTKTVKGKPCFDVIVNPWKVHPTWKRKN